MTFRRVGVSWVQQKLLQKIPKVSSFNNINIHSISRGVSSTSLAMSSSRPFYAPTLVEKRIGEMGAGGRSSDAGLKVALFGAGGFLGTHVCAELGTNGYMAYIGNRGDDMEMRHLKLSFDLGRTRFVFYGPRDEESIHEVIADADVVVNMIGKYHETGRLATKKGFPFLKYQVNYSLYDANVMMARTIAQICRDRQVDHLIHVSSASASPTSQSEWSRTKYEGEMAVREIYPWATIIRPTQMFGRTDMLLNWFAKMHSNYGMVPLANGGKSLTQPVWVGDVARTILRVIDGMEQFDGRTVDCFGPVDYTYEELAQFVDSITQRKIKTFELPNEYYKPIANLLQWRRRPLMTPDLVDLWCENFLPPMSAEDYRKQPDDSNKVLTMEDIGIKATPIEKKAFSYLVAYRMGGPFFRTEGYHQN